MKKPKSMHVSLRKKKIQKLSLLCTLCTFITLFFVGSEEWENTAVSERYNMVPKAKENEKKLRVQKRFSGALEMLGDDFMSSEKFVVSFHIFYFV